jgi:serine/threonine-protein kinase
MVKQLKDEYEIVSEIGAGGMARVYKAVQKSLGRPVAIKELKKEFLGDDRIVRRFEREAKTAASFQHENIVHIYDYWRKPACSIVMEYVDGTSLSEVITKAGPLPVDIGVMIAIQVCNALDYAHMRGVVHRDIKPSNVMIRRNGEVKLMDFGIAQVRDLESLTIPGMLMGTPSYMSPEQVAGEPLDTRSDIFSLGIVLYEMFTGLKPFMDEHTQSITAKIVQCKFLPPRRLNSDVPRRLQRVIKRCLKKKPGRRYASVQEVARALGKLVRGRTDKSVSLKRISDYLVVEELVERTPEQETIVLARDSFGLGTYSKLLVAGAVALLLLMAALGYYFWSTGRQAGPASLISPSTVPLTGEQPAPAPAGQPSPQEPSQ